MMIEKVTSDSQTYIVIIPPVAFKNGVMEKLSATLTIALIKNSFTVIQSFL